MKVYLVDFENVKSKGLAGVDKLTEYDRVIIFYSENADTINFEMHQRVMMSKADVEYFKVNVGGKNALDFQLSTLLGYLVATKGYSHLFVISNDKSFDFLHDFWHGKYITSPDCVVYRTRTISAAINYSSTKKAEDGSEDGSMEDMDIPQNEPVFAHETVQAQVPESHEKTAADEEPVKAEPAPAEEKAPEAAKEEEKRPALDDSRLFEYYQQFYNDSVEESHKNEVKPEPEHDNKTLDDVINGLIKDKGHEETARETSGEKDDKKPVAEKTQPAEPQKPADINNGTFEDMFFEALEGSGCTEDEVERIATLLVESETKEEFHNGLAKEFKQQATELYKTLRPRYLRLKEKYNTENGIVPEKPAEDTKQESKPETANVPAKVTAEEKPKADEAPVKEKADEKPKQENKPKADEKPKQENKPKADEKPKQESKPKAAKAPAKEKTEEKPQAKKQKQENKPKAADKPGNVKSKLADLLNGICTKEELATITELFENADTKQQLYIRMVKAFKKDKGCKFYNAIKSEYSALKS